MKFQLIILSFIVLGSNKLLLANGPRKTGSPQSLSERVELLTDLNARRPVLKFNLQKFRDFVKAGPRNYSIVIMFTALAPARQCAICRHAHDEYVNILANSYRYSETYSNKLFFAMVDFDDGSDVFQLLRLNTAPVFMHFPAKGKPKAADTLDIQRSGYMAEALSKWIQERTDIQIRVFRPPNYTGTFAILTLGSLVVGVLYMRRNNLEFLYNKRIWGVLALTFCFAMISGQMWNHIRTPPLMHRGANGGIAYIHGSSQAQLIIETYIIMFLNAMIVLGMILLTESGQQNDQRKGRFMAIIGLVLVAIFFSLLLSVFRSKAQGYPYSFLFK